VAGKRSVTVDVAGQTLTLKTDAADEYVASLASYVSGKISEVKTSSRITSTQTLAILAAINLADELFQEREAGRRFKGTVRDKSQRILELIEGGGDAL
jgi:cell division protein ZapA